MGRMGLVHGVGRCRYLPRTILDCLECPGMKADQEKGKGERVRSHRHLHSEVDA